MSLPVIHKLLEPFVLKFISTEEEVTALSSKIRNMIDDQAQHLPSQHGFSNLMTKLMGSGLDLLNFSDAKDLIRYKIAGLTIFDCLLDVNDEILPERRIEIANHICKVLENDKLPLAINHTVLRTASISIGHFARIASLSEIEFLQNFYFPLSLKLLNDARSEAHRFSGTIIMLQLAYNSPVLIFSKRKVFFEKIFDVICDRNALIRDAAAETLEAGLQLIAQREPIQEYARLALSRVTLGLGVSITEKAIGSLMILNVLVEGTAVSLPDLLNTLRIEGTQPQDIVWRVFKLKDSRDAEVRQKVIEILPNLASAFSGTFLQENSMFLNSQSFLNYALNYLIGEVRNKKDRQIAYIALGNLYMTMASYLPPDDATEIFGVICSGFRDPFCVEAIQCLGLIVSASPAVRKLVDPKTVDLMFRGGLSLELVDNLKIIIKLVPKIRHYAQQQLRNHITEILKRGKVMVDEADFGRSSIRLQRTGWANSITLNPMRESRGLFRASSTPSVGMDPDHSIRSINPLTGRSEKEIVFALKTLSSQEFFPRYSREKSGEEDQSIHLLAIVRDCIVRYLDDFYSDVRSAAAQACAAILDTVVLYIDPSSVEFKHLILILDRLLIMGLGDDRENIRIEVLKSFTPSLDHVVSLTENLHCLIEALQDESLQVRAAAMTMISRVAHYDSLHVLPVVRLTLKRLLLTLTDAQNQVVKQESVCLLEALVKGSSSLIMPYVKQIIIPLLSLLKDQSDGIVVAALSTIGELAVASAVSVREHLDDLTPQLIEALNDQSSVLKQETAVIAMGKLVSSLTIVVTREPYKKYQGLFEGLVRAIRSVGESSYELRLQAIKTVGLLGTVDIHEYQRYLTHSKSVKGSYSSQIDKLDALEEEDREHIEDAEPDVNEVPDMDKYYMSVVMRELVAVLKDSSLAQHHHSASTIAVKVVRIMGAHTMQVSSQVQELFDAIMFRLYIAEPGNNIRDALLDHIISLICMVRKGISPFLERIIKLLENFCDTHLQLCLDIIEALSLTISTPDFLFLLRQTLPVLHKAVDDEVRAASNLELREDMDLDGDGALSIGGSAFLRANASASISAAQTGKNMVVRPRKVSTSSMFFKTIKILQHFVNISENLGEYKREMIPFVVNLIDCPVKNGDIKKEAICTAMHLVQDADVQEFAGRIIHPLLRVLTGEADATLQGTAITTLSCLVCRLGTGFVPYIISVRRQTRSAAGNAMRGVQSTLGKLEEYESLVNRLLKQRPLPPEPTDVSDIRVKASDRIKHRLSAVSSNPDTDFQLNLQSLETAWALARRNNAADITEWMHRLSIELIRQSPSIAIRACASMAKSYRALAEKLFNASFHCLWDNVFAAEAGDQVDELPLINGIEMALNSPHTPKSILVQLLDLAEFMQMQDKPLPMDIRLLGQQARAANMFAKCLYYREIEFNSKIITPSIQCIDELISVSNQLGLIDRAAGRLENIKIDYPFIEIEPEWLEKLCEWDEARASYQQKIALCKQQYPDKQPPSSKEWLASELGRLRCLQAVGEYEELEDGARTLKEQIQSSREVEDYSLWASLSEVQRLGANASWSLGEWDSMNQFLEGESRVPETKDVVLEQNLSFYKAIMAIHSRDYEAANTLIEDTRNELSSSISSLLSESYSRAYPAMVTMQVLAEMEEVIDYKQAVEKAATELEALKNSASSNEVNLLNESPSRYRRVSSDASTPRHDSPAGGVDLISKKYNLIQKWKGRLKWAPKEVHVYKQILAVHTLIAEPLEDLDSWLELVDLCMKQGMFSLCENILRKLGSPLPPRRPPTELDTSQASVEPNLVTELHYHDTEHTNERVLFSTYEYLWSLGEKTKALNELTEYLKANPVPTILTTKARGYSSHEATMFRVNCLLQKAEWMRELNEGEVTETMQILLEARDLADNHYSVWHAWAVANYDQIKKADTKDVKNSTPPTVDGGLNLAAINESLLPPTGRSSSPAGSFERGKIASRFNYVKQRRLSSTSGSASLLNLLSSQQVDSVTSYIVEAIKGFVRSIILGKGEAVANVLQDTLRLITLWFSYGTKRGVYQILESELDKISPQNWLSVIPQLIARIHIKSPEISGLMRKLLVRVAATHPQALVCPISVALNTNNPQQRMVAAEVLTELRKHGSQLVEEATLVSRELMRVAVTPHELWYDGLEQAAQQYLDNRDLAMMTSVLMELHDTMNDSVLVGDQLQPNEGFSERIGKIGHVTLRDVSFRQNYEKSLADAHVWLERFKNTGQSTDLHQAWEIYQALFKRIKVQISNLKKLELHHVSPALTTATDLSLAVPGTYKPNATVIGIKGFSPRITVIASKQRPRRMSMLGSDGKRYHFLLKGHEDLRQDERVMQLFGLINACLKNDNITSNRDLGIVRYSVLPLSNNSGVIGWVQNCDTINQLVKQHREARNIRLLTETKLLQSKTMNYDKLPVIHKVELFTQVLEETSGQDLAKMLWLKSKTADIWVERRANFTKSLGVMSMAGYILGLGDRHPSNLMVDRVSGRVVHIDFGDCFEITKQRSKFPEIIPFRLTRMLINCMEVAGMHGSYRLACERVMRVLRDNRDSLMAMLEAFVYDPLISWRLLANRGENGGLENGKNDAGPGTSNSDNSSMNSSIEVSLENTPGGSSMLLLGGEPPLAGLVGSIAGRTGMTLGGSMRFPMGSLSRSMAQDRAGIVTGDGVEPIQENLNARALEVINRIQAKLTGRDFAKSDEAEETNDATNDLTEEQQVDRLIEEATSVENLCQLFPGWCPLW